MVKNGLYVVGCGFLIGVAAGCAAPSFSVVTVPVADVRATPGSSSTPGTHDPLQETQLLYGERVKVLKTDGPWAFIEAVEQAEYTHANTWQGYPGWVRRDALKPDGSTLPSLDSLRSFGPSTTLTSCRARHSVRGRAESRTEAEGLGTQPRSYGASQAVVSAKWATLWADASAAAALMQVPIGTTLLLTKTDGPLLALRLFDGRPAWITRRDVRFLDELRRLPVEFRRQAVVRAAEQLLGDPYFWGGRSPRQESGATPATEAGTPPTAGSPKGVSEGAAGGPTEAGTPPPGGVAEGRVPPHSAFRGLSDSGRSRSAETRSVRPTGVDCSGLVNLAYRTVGLDIPRDAHEQYVRARKITTPHPADLLFLSSPDDPRKIVHVMLYAGDGWLIEGPGTGLAVRRIEVTTRLGLSVQDLIPGQRIGNQVLYVGTYFGF